MKSKTSDISKKTLRIKLQNLIRIRIYLRYLGLGEPKSGDSFILG